MECSSLRQMSSDKMQRKTVRVSTQKRETRTCKWLLKCKQLYRTNGKCDSCNLY